MTKRKHLKVRLRGVGQTLRVPIVLLVFTFLLAILCLEKSRSETFLATETAKLSLLEPLVVEWSYKTDQTLNFTPAIADGNLYVPLSAGNLIALRLSDGKFEWRAEMGGDISAAPVADERSVYVASQTITPLVHSARTGGILRALSRNSGVTIWSRNLSTPLKAVLAIDNTTIYGCGGDGSLYSIDKDSGALRWVLSHSSPLLGSPHQTAEKVYIASRDGSLLAIDKKTGKSLWRYQTPSLSITSIAVGIDRIFLGTSDGYIYAIEETSGVLAWRVRNGSGIQALIDTQLGLVATASDNFVYFLSQRRGKRIWKRQLPGRVASIPAVLAHHAFFCPLSGDECVVLDLKSGRRVNRLVVNDDDNTSASPQLAEPLIIVTTRQGILAFTNPNQR